MHTAIRKPRKPLPETESIIAVIGAILLLVLPFFYRERMSEGIQKNDMYLIWTIGLIAWTGFRPKSVQKPELIFGAGVCLAAVSYFLYSQNDVNSAKVLATLFSGFGIYCYLRAFPKTERYLVWMLIPSLLCQLIIGLGQLYQYQNDPLMIQGTFSNSGYFANFLAPSATALLVATRVGIRHRNRYQLGVNIFIAIVLLATGYLLFTTMARAALIGFGAACVFLGWIELKNKLKRIWRKTIIFTLTLSIIGLCAILYRAKEPSALGRVVIYKVSLHMIADHFLLGVGPNRFQAYYNSYQGLYFRDQSRSLQTQLLASDTYEAFNFLLQWWAEYGLLSLALGILFVYHIIRYGISEIQHQKRIQRQHGIMAALLCIFCSGLFSNPFHCPIIFLLCILLLASIRKPPEIDPKWTVSRRTLFFLKSVPVLCAAIFLFWGFLQWEAEKKWSMAMLLSRNGHFDKAKPLYQTAYIHLKNDGRFLYNYGAESFLAGETEKSIELLERDSAFLSASNVFMYLGMAYMAQGKTHAAENKFLTALYIKPSQLLPKYQLIKLLLQTNRKKEAAQWLDYTLRYPIKIKNDVTDDLMSELKSLKIEK